MNGSKERWPPLIVAEHVPRLVKWRDVLLTLFMWGLLVLLLDTELALFFGRLLGRLGLGSFNADPNWPDFFERLMPFLVTAAVLAAGLVLAGLYTLRHHRWRAPLLPQPISLSVGDQAHGAGLEETALAAARDQRIVIVHIDADGRYQIATPHR